MLSDNAFLFHFKSEKIKAYMILLFSPIFRTIMEKVEDFIYGLQGSQREVLLFLHEKLMGLNLLPKIRYRIPFYYGKSWICHLNPRQETSIEMCFVRGNELSNQNGLLDAKGRKQVASTLFNKVETIDESALLETIHEAILLDETVPYASKRKPAK